MPRFSSPYSNRVRECQAFGVFSDYVMQGIGRAVAVSQPKGAPDNQSRSPSKKQSGASKSNYLRHAAAAGRALVAGRSNGKPKAAIFSDDHDDHASWLKPSKPSPTAKGKKRLSGHAPVVADVNDSDTSLGDSDIMDDEFEERPDGPDAGAFAPQGPESNDEEDEEEEDDEDNIDEEKEDSDDDEAVCSITGLDKDSSWFATCRWCAWLRHWNR